MKKKKPEISIIVNCLNGEKFVRRCLRSILKQTYKNFEVIFWDNNSSDNSLHEVKKFKSRKIRIFKSKNTYKLYNARNKAISKCFGKYICFLDIDDTWEIDKLEKQLKAISTRNVDLVYTNYLIVRGKSKLLFNKNIDNKNIVKLILIRNPISISTILVKKKSLNKVNNFNKNYEIIGDFDFYYKFCKKFKTYYIDEPLVKYNIHGDNYSILKEDLRITEMNNWLIKNGRDKFAKKYLNEFQFVRDKNIYMKIVIILRNKRNTPVIKEIFKIKSFFLKIKSIIRLFYSYI